MLDPSLCPSSNRGGITKEAGTEIEEVEIMEIIEIETERHQGSLTDQGSAAEKEVISDFAVDDFDECNA